MDEKKLCPLAVVARVGHDECAEAHRAWWHGGMCDVGRIAAQMTVMPALMQRLAGDTDASELENAVMRSAEAFSDKEAGE